MQFCQWYDDGEGGRFLIPGCLARANNPDIGQCTCSSLEQQLADARRQLDEIARSRASLQAWHDQIVRAVYAHPSGTQIMKTAADCGATVTAETAGSR